MVAEDDRAPEIVTDSPPFAIAVRLRAMWLSPSCVEN
jgi:hypothetical protein